MVNYKKDQMHNKANRHMPLSLVFISLMLITAPTFAKKAQSSVKPTVVNNMIGDGNASMCSNQISSPSKLTIPLGKSTLIKLPEPLASRTVGNVDVLQAKMISPLTLYVVGLDIGSTNMILQSKNGTCTIIDVTVSMDPDALQQALLELMPEEKDIMVTAAGESLILSGTVQDATAANQAVNIAQAYVSRVLKPVSAKLKDNQTNETGNQQSIVYSQYSEKPNPRVINMLSIGAQQQVMLEVKVAEISKTLLDKLGIDFAIGKVNGNSSFGFNLIPNIVPTATPVIGGQVISRFAESPNLGVATGSNDSFRSALIDAEKRDGLVKVLAEPSIMAISGQEGSFLAGGTIFIPVAQQNGNGVANITLEEKPFGVSVKFTPTVLAGGRINLQVSPEVSELSRQGVGLSAAGVTGASILPAFTVRRASTTVQLMDGQSFAIGGLIKNNTTTNIKAFPILGEIPILGALFRSTEFQKDKTELVFVVTPHLVKPIAKKDVRLPTDGYVDPSRTDLFLKGKMEGTLPPDAPPPVAPSNKSDAVKPNELMPSDNTGFDME